MGFLNKTRETAGLKGPVGKDGKKKVATAVIPEATAQQEKKPQKAALLNFFKTSSHATANSQYNNNPPPPPYTPVDPSLQQQQQEQPQQQIPIVPVIATQIPILNTPAPKITTTPSTSTPAAASPLDWHIPGLIFMVEGKRIPSHKVVLISRCAHFARLLTDIPAGSVTTIEIVDFPHHIFSRFVRLVYGGKKDNISPEDAPELVRCALQYEAPEIATICQEVVAEANEKLKAEQEERERQEMLLKQQQQQLEQEQQIQAYPQPTEMELQQQMQLQLQMQYYQQQQQQQQQQFQQQQQQLYQQQQFGFAEQQQQQQQQQEHYEQQQQQMQLGFEIDMANFVTAEESLQAFDNNYGMNMWSNDPVLFNANENSFEMNEGYRIMEIC